MVRGRIRERVSRTIKVKQLTFPSDKEVSETGSTRRNTCPRKNLRPGPGVPSFNVLCPKTGSTPLSKDLES